MERDRLQPQPFDALAVETPDAASLAARFDGYLDDLASATTTDAALRAIADWDDYSRQLSTWRNLAEIHFQQATNNQTYRQRKTDWDALTPTVLEQSNRVKRCLLAHPLRAELENTLGAQAFRIWAYDNQSFSEAIADGLRRESQLVTDYTALIGSATCEIDGAVYNLASAARFLSSIDRNVRRATDAARCAWYSANQERLDTIYEQLVRCRTEMAAQLGFSNFIQLGYLRLHRSDYGATEVAMVRDWVADEIVPLCGRLYQQQRQALGLDRLCFYDELILDASPPPKPLGEPQWIVEQGKLVFSAIHPELGRFFREMVAGDYCDLITRDHKAPGGFCAELPSQGTTFIYSNFNGTKADVDVLVHEMGHAFQCARSDRLPLLDYLWPTMEGAEITSIGLELLAYGQADKFFGPDAARYRQQHLTQSVTFMPYGAAVDHFQHEVYRLPHAGPEARNQIWQAMEARYLPHRDYDGQAYPESGRIWQRKHHIYSFPFYYIDYVLAFICAVQLHVMAQTDPDAALASYLRLAELGGSRSFLALLDEAGLRSPFESATLSALTTQLARALEV